MAATIFSLSPDRFQNVMQGSSLAHSLNSCLSLKDLYALSQTSKSCKELAFLHKEYGVLQHEFEDIRNKNIRFLASIEKQGKNPERGISILFKVRMLSRSLFLYKADKIDIPSKSKTVYRGYDCASKQLVAIADFAKKQSLYSREMDMYGFTGPSFYVQKIICKIRNVTENTIIAPLAIGDNLFTYFTKNRKLSALRQIDLMWQVALGVQHMHGKGIVHLDLKPENILVTHEGTKIMDLAGAQWQGNVWKCYSATTTFCPPEVLRLGYPMKPKDLALTVEFSFDIWSLGMVLYSIHKNAYPGWFDVIKCAEKDGGWDDLMTNFQKEAWMERCLSLDKGDFYLPLFKKMFKFNPAERPKISEVMRDLAKIRTQIYTVSEK